MRTKINFRAHENIFLCARKFIFFRKEIFFLAEGNFKPSASSLNRLLKRPLARGLEDHLTPACL